MYICLYFRLTLSLRYYSKPHSHSVDAVLLMKLSSTIDAYGDVAKS